MIGLELAESEALKLLVTGPLQSFNIQLNSTKFLTAGGTQEISSYFKILTPLGEQLMDLKISERNL